GITPASASSSGRLSHSISTRRSSAVTRVRGWGGPGTSTYQCDGVSVPFKPVQASQSKSLHTQPLPNSYVTSCSVNGGGSSGSGWWAGPVLKTFPGQGGSYLKTMPGGGS